MSKKARAAEPELDIEPAQPMTAASARKNTRSRNPESTKKAVESARREATIYVGPNIPGGSLVRNTVFRDGVAPRHVQIIVERCPAIQLLIVPVSKLAATQQKLIQRGTMENTKYQEIVKHFARGAK